MTAAAFSLNCGLHAQGSGRGRTRCHHQSGHPRRQNPRRGVWSGHNGQVVYRKAYGYRALLPAKEPMTIDTIFDIASLTKIVATTSAMMKLFEQGRYGSTIRTVYLPEFQGGDSAITSAI